ncbi:hypothetical protein Tco_0664456 [Tanacetum coccineum]
MLDSEAYMTYRAYATGEKTLKPKITKKKADFEASPKTKTTQATKGKQIKSLAKGDKAAKKKQPAETSIDKGLTKSSEEDDKDEVNVSEKDDDNDNNDDDDDADNQDDENPDEENHDDDDDDEQTDSDNDGDDFVHPKFSTHDDEARQEEVHEEDSFDPRFQTPSHDESTDDDNSDEEV